MQFQRFSPSFLSDIELRYPIHQDRDADHAANSETTSYPALNHLDYIVEILSISVPYPYQPQTLCYR